MKNIWNLLGSRNLSVFIFIMGLTYVFVLTVFSAFIPQWWVNNISKLLPYRVLYVLFFINLIICEIKWIPVVIRKCRKPEMPESEDDLKRFGNKVKLSNLKGIKSQCPDEDKGSSLIGRLERHLRRKGYRINNAENKDNSTLNSQHSTLFYACRGRFSPLGNLFFHVSFLFLLAGVLVSFLYRFEGNVLLMEGQLFAGEMADYGSVRRGPLSGLPDLYFEVSKITPEFWDDELLFTDLAADITFEYRMDVARLSSAANYDGARITIQSINYTPKYILRDLTGQELDVGYVNLVNFSPGSSDSFKIPGFPHKINVSIYPDFTDKDGKLATNTMNLLRPYLYVRVERNKYLAYEGTLGFRDEAYFDGLALSFPEIKYNATFLIVKDQGHWLIWIGLVLMGIGLVWKMLFYKRELALCGSQGSIYLYTNSDYYPNLFKKKNVAMLKKLQIA